MQAHHARSGDVNAQLHVLSRNVIGGDSNPCQPVSVRVNRRMNAVGDSRNTLEPGKDLRTGQHWQRRRPCVLDVINYLIVKQDFPVCFLPSLSFSFFSIRWGWYLHVVLETPGFDLDPPVSSIAPLNLSENEAVRQRHRSTASAPVDSCAHVVLSCTPSGFHPNTSIPPCAR